MPVCPKCGHEGSSVGGKCPYDEYYFVAEDIVKEAKRDPFIGTLAAEKFVILSLISEGGMGAVYRALQLPVEREVAFKVLRAELKGSDQGRDRFIREARAVSRLTHPNIITLHDFGFDENDFPYMVMEYAPGVSLAGWLVSQTPTLDRVVHIIEQILAALTDAHEQGIVHRDLKPDNLIIQKSGVDPDFVKLLDFGIARMINEGATRSLTREGEVFGTPHYMAPEQAQGKKDIGPAADIYAVGIMFFQMLSGATPYDAPTPLAVLFQHINEPIPELLGQQGIVIPESVRQVVFASMSKDPKDRYQSAGEMLLALKRAASGPRTSGLSAAINDGVTGRTIPPGSSPLQLKTMGGPTPQFEIAAGESTGERVSVFDPDPSIERERPLMAPPSGPVAYDDFDEGFQEEKGVRTALYLGIGVVATVIMVLMAVVITAGDEDAEAATETPIVAQPEKTPPKVEPKKVEPKKVPIKAAVAVKEPAKVVEPVEKATPPVVEKKKVEKVPKKVTKKKVEPKKAEPKKVEPIKVEPKEEPKKNLKWKSKDPPKKDNRMWGK